jgi:U32 family peptidase
MKSSGKLIFAADRRPVKIQPVGIPSYGVMNHNKSYYNQTGGEKTRKPEILAPAGGKEAFLAALAAGADAVYCGLKRLSARMAAENFTVEELIPLARLARQHNTAVYVALNSLIKPDETDMAAGLLDRLSRDVNPDALIIQDLGFLELARQVGFTGQIHLSTLANAGFSEAIRTMGRFPEITRVVLPRELSIDEIKQLADRCPEHVSLEVFVHGALCYAVSGRCYWSSFMGGKSSLRGRCVQPCRRIYRQRDRQQRFFSCQDLGVDVLTKILTAIPTISSLKIEGRKKGPHYVYYTVSAYRLLRDHAGDPKAKKTALGFLEYALGRNTTHYNLLSQRPHNPIAVDVDTGSGLLIGRIGKGSGRTVSVREALLPDDRLRIGYEDAPWHAVIRMNRYVPSKGRINVKSSGKTPPPPGTPVFLIDRRDQELARRIDELAGMLISFEKEHAAGISEKKTALPGRKKPAGRVLADGPVVEMTVWRKAGQMQGRSTDAAGLWLAPESRNPTLSAPSRLWCWLPPVVWPEQEEALHSAIRKAVKQGCVRFVANAPGQIGFFEKSRHVEVWAGPFCNASNPLAVNILRQMGFSGVIVGPELAAADYETLPSGCSLPLGIVTSGNWPLCISRTRAESLETGILFTSPRAEGAWAAAYGPDTWVFPDWEIDLFRHQAKLQSSGFRLFVRLREPVPPGITIRKRPGLWNWETGLA